MIRRSATRGARRAFTLVELLIVILLIAILLAFIVPQFFGAREKAGDRVAQQALRQAVSTAKVLAQDNESFDRGDGSAPVDALERQEGNIAFTTGASEMREVETADGAGSVDGNQRTVSVFMPGPDNGQTLVLAALGENNACWFVELHYGADGAGNSRADVYGFSETAPADCSAEDMFADTDAPRGEGEFPSRS